MLLKRQFMASSSLEMMCLYTQTQNKQVPQVNVYSWLRIFITNGQNYLEHDKYTKSKNLIVHWKKGNNNRITLGQLEWIA